MPWYIQKGGVVLALIILGSVIGVAIVLERFFYLRKVDKNARMVMERVREKLREGRIGEAIAVCENHPGPASNIVKAGLEHSDRGREDIEKAIQDAAKIEMPRLERFLPTLGTIVNVSPLLGLLGTVLGMIKSSMILSKSGLTDLSGLIGGIAEALVTTAGGLIVAIPLLVAYNLLVAKVNSLVSYIEARTTELVLMLSDPSKGKWREVF